MNQQVADIQNQIASYMGKLLRDNFGKGPESVYVTIAYDMISIYIRGFMSPSEQVLMSLQQESLLTTTRDLVMRQIVPEIKAHIAAAHGMEIEELYYDWGLHNRSAMLVGICKASVQGSEKLSDQYPGKEMLHEEMISVSELAQKAPEELHSYRMNDKTLVVIRKGILVMIEKQLIRDGHETLLKVSKRSLEKRLLHNNNRFEAILNTKIKDVYTDWDFSLDKSVTVFCF